MCFAFRFRGKYILKSKLVCETGLHIGGTAEGFEIGGLDNPVIKDPLTDEPYIPGSSLKGKLRSLLEWSLGPNEFRGELHHFTQDQKASGKPTFSPCSCGQCASCVLFGVTPKNGVTAISKLRKTEGTFAASEEVVMDDKTEIFFLTGPTRLTIRDGFLTDSPSCIQGDYKTKTEIEQLIGQNLFTEIKTENALNRITAEANPRPMERVPKGAGFEIEMVFDVYRIEDKELLRALFTAMHLLEESALGGTVSRGSGKVRFTELSAKFRPLSYYETCDESSEEDVKEMPQTVAGIVRDFDHIQWNFPAEQDGMHNVIGEK